MRRFTTFFLVAAFSLGLLSFAGESYLFFRASLVPKSVSATVKVYPNDTIQTVVKTLQQQGLLHHPTFFTWIFTLTDHRLHFGEYQIQYPISAWRLMQNMSSGVGLARHKITIVEGWTMADIWKAIAKNPDLTNTLSREHSVRASTAEFCGEFNQSCEGLLYPSTYIFFWGNTDQVILKEAYAKMQTVLKSAWDNRDLAVPYQTPYQALIVASMIERETAVLSEKPMIASVIINRLSKNMRLQIDPTVLYGLGLPYGTPITKKDLQSRTKYNTYEITGLPPTPICMPSESSINAALHPATTDYLFYVANGMGGHVFSKTYAEHLTHVYHS